MNAAVDREAIEQMRDAVRAFAKEVDGVGRVRADAEVRATGIAPVADRGVWQRLNDELGLCALVVPEKLGGLGAGEVAAALALEELGYMLEPAPAWSSLNAARALSAGFDSTDALDGLLSGQLTGTLATTSAGPRATPEVWLRSDGALDGIAHAVPDGYAADVVVVLAERDGRPVLVVADMTTAAAESRRALPGTDLVRTYADLDLADVNASVVTDDPAEVQRCQDRADLSLAAELLGGARACLDRTVEYLLVREQFGRVIGSFQGLQHTVASLAVQIEQTRAVLDLALAATDADDDLTSSRVAPLARAAAAETFVHGADVLIHLHGGTGFTWEHDAHLFFRRARASAAWGGTPASHYAEAACRGCAQLLNTT